MHQASRLASITRWRCWPSRLEWAALLVTEMLVLQYSSMSILYSSIDWTISTSSDDHRVLIPPACGAAMAAVYSTTLQELQEAGHLPRPLSHIVVIVCGGSGVNLDTIQQWKKTYNL